jgi:hypothetical protein
MQMTRSRLLDNRNRREEMPSYDPIHLTFNDKPEAIVHSMDNMAAQGDRIAKIQKRRRWFPLLLFLAGFPFILIDIAIRALGYQVCIFSLTAPVFWLVALILYILTRRRHGVQPPPRFFYARRILYTLRDDVHPKRNFFGHLDLTGTQTEDKVARETSDARGRVTQYFRDEWFSVKAKLFDGNMLRFSAITRKKVRKGYWKRGTISGKMKWKSEKYKGTHQEMRVRLSVNPQVYIAPEGGPLAPGMRIGAYTVKKYQASGGIVDLAAYFSGERVSADEVLGLLHSVYDLLERRVAL